MEFPILYSFRRCPYAMRARMALKYSEINYIHREIKLSNRPDELYKISPKGTVPVMMISDDKIIEESYQKAQHYINLASNALTVFEESKEKHIFKNITSFSLARNF